MEYVCKTILRVWDGGRNINLDQAKISPSRDSAFNVADGRVRKDSHDLFVWLAETWTKRWLIENKLEMPDLPWFNGEGFKAMERLEC